jgi:pantoate--beta-alanine ligase
MIIFKTTAGLSEYVAKYKHADKRIGFVPTMGALHKGHLSLIDKCKATCDVTIVSIFVNPIQFNDKKDFDNYPVTTKEDSILLQGMGVDAVFMPVVEEMYPEAPVLKMSFGYMEDVMEGIYRPGHLAGVGLVVSKLFNIVQPDEVFFGQKDYQQCMIIKKLIQDLSYPIRMHICPTLRESDGLAMSSRNKRLSEATRRIASHIYKSLVQARDYIISVPDSTHEEAKKRAKEYLKQFPEIKLEYIESVDKRSLQPLSGIVDVQNTILCIACWLEDVRLIDNILVKD